MDIKYLTMDNGGISVHPKAYEVLQGKDELILYFHLLTKLNMSIEVTDKGEPILINLSQIQLSNELRMDKRKIRKLLKGLEDMKLISVDKKKGGQGASDIILSFDLFEEDTKEQEEKIKKDLTSERLKKLKEIGGMTMKEKSILELSQHYDMLVRQVKKLTGFRSLSIKDPTHHKNWKYFEKVFDICNENNWDGKLYIEYAFEHVRRYWKKAEFPYASQLCGVKIQNSFIRWLEEENRKYEHQIKGQTKKKAKKTTDYYTDLYNSIEHSIKRLSNSLNSDNDLPRDVGKLFYLLDDINMYSTAYLYTIDAIRNDVVGHMDIDNQSVKELLEDFSFFDKSIKYRTILFYIVGSLESKYNIPKNISFKNFNDFVGV